jgi:hypothetical protein
MNSDPISRVCFARDEIDRVFGAGHAASHPDMVCAVMISAGLDYAGGLIGRAIDNVAGALVEEVDPELDEPVSSRLLRPNGGPMLR